VRRHERRSSAKPTGPDPVRGPEGDLGPTLRQAATALDLAIPATFADHAATYLDELERWQRLGGLTGYRDRGARMRHLLLESLMLLSVVPARASPLLDIGSGPGVPGLILKLARPEWEVVLVEAARRPANFLRHIIRQLGLEGVIVHWARAEALAVGPLAGRFQTVTMRAVASGEAARRLATPFLTPDGALVRPVGPREGPVGETGRVVTLDVPGELPWRRQFLIIRRTELERDVSRGTRRTPEPKHRGREPEGRRRQDHDGRQSG
jgi:16S rRNA (guanine527-N7)-methyltransferase